MRAELLEINGFDFIDIQEFYSELLPNKHGKAVIGGTIRGDKKEEYLSYGGKVTQIIAETYKLMLEKLGMNYSYTIIPFDSHNTEKAIKNFNNNMKHIRVWNEQEKNIRQFLKARVWRSSKRLNAYKKCLSI